MLGRWEGHSITKRSGVYGATISEADTVALIELNDKGQLIQVCDIWNVWQFKLRQLLSYTLEIDNDTFFKIHIIELCFYLINH